MTTSTIEGALPVLQIGDFLIQAISDGHLTASLDLLSDIDPVEATQLQLKAGVRDPSSIHINTFLVQGKGRTILIVTHDLAVARHCPREIYIRDGKIVTPPEQVAGSPIAEVLA